MNSVRLISISMAVVAVNLANIASSQLAPGYSGQSDGPVVASESEYWLFVAELGACLVRTKRPSAVAFLNAAPDTPAAKAAFGRLINRNGANMCMQNMVTAGIVTGQLRGAIAEGLFKSRKKSVSIIARHDGAKIGEPRTLDDFADCYVANHVTETTDLLMTTALGTKAEQVRIGKMAASFGDCLPLGREVRLKPTDVRLALASALYRATELPVAGQGTR